MNCIVPGCSELDQEYLVEFPAHPTLAERWQRAIELGTGRALTLEAQQTHQLCLSHFSAENDPELAGYQEPSRFEHWNGDQVEVSSCRICLEFELQPRMFATNGKMGHVTLSSVVQSVLRITISSDDFLTQICEKCLVKVDIMKCWTKEVFRQEMAFQKLADLTKIEQKEQETEDLPEMILVPEVKLEHETDSDENGSNEDTLSDEEVSDKNDNTDKLRKTTRTKPRISKKSDDERNNLEKLPLNDILARKCYICDIIHETSEELIAHLVGIHAGKMDYKCKDCGKQFVKVASYNRHLSFHDITDRPEKCSFCTFSFRTNQCRKFHENKEHGTNHVVPRICPRKNKVQCDSCGKTFWDVSALRMHKQFHHNTRPFTSCKLCGKNFASKAGLERHSVVHTKERPYKCDQCPATFKQSTLFSKHILRHQNILPYKCRHCDERFKSQSQYDKHRFSVHVNKLQKPLGERVTNPFNRLIICQICRQSFKLETELQNHINAAHADETYPYHICPDCPTQFLQERQLQLHRNIHTDRYMCKICNKRNSNPATLKNHMVTHNQVQSFQCPICAKKFNWNSSYSRHMNTHSDEKKYKCDLCDRGFNQSGNLLNHRRTHTGERPYSCLACGKSFKDDPSYYKHRKRCLEKHTED